MIGQRATDLAKIEHDAVERILGKGFDRPVLDFGCGTGALTRLLVTSFPQVDGYDPSSDDVEVARVEAPGATFYDDPEALPKDFYGSIVLANVLHQVPAEKRGRLLRTVFDLLGPDGRLVVFEKNPYRPFTRRDGDLMTSRDLRRRLVDAGFQDVERDYIAFFPKVPAPLAKVRAIEPRLARVPLGAEICAWGWK
jgi:SAM-dependent methyltransferase